MIKISPSISSFPLPPFQKQPSEHDTRGRRSSLFALGRRREKGISIRLPPPPPPLHYLHKSCLCRRRRHVCCEQHGDGARPPTSCLVARPATCHSPSAAGPSFCGASVGEIMFICSGLFTRSIPPSVRCPSSPLPPHSGWLPRCCSLGAAACGCGGRCGG